jgi:hypothetical protein
MRSFPFLQTYVSSAPTNRPHTGQRFLVLRRRSAFQLIAAEACAQTLFTGYSCLLRYLDAAELITFILRQPVGTIKRTMKRTLAIDLDEVLGQFVQALAKFHNSAYPSASMLDAASFFSYRFADVWGGDDAESIEKVHAFFQSDFFLNIPVVEGAVAGVEVC